MSLINDALKQAKQSQTKTPPSGAPPLPPVEHRSQSGGGGSMWILVVAAILFLVAAILFFKMPGSKHETILAPTNAPEPVVTQVEPVKTNPPAMTVTNTPPVEQLPKIQGIIFDPAKPWAIVNRKTVYVGNKVGDYTVKAITRNSVTFQRLDGSLQEIKLAQ